MRHAKILLLDTFEPQYRLRHEPRCAKVDSFAHVLAAVSRTIMLSFPCLVEGNSGGYDSSYHDFRMLEGSFRWVGGGMCEGGYEAV
jgi:hypothetical protein